MINESILNKNPYICSQQRNKLGKPGKGRCTTSVQEE